MYLEAEKEKKAQTTQILMILKVSAVRTLVKA